ncbi:hypothetical protein EDD11_009138 [Mortierella claussenii]|nr:hypothetical protein EDD11_009138 [Mortierella claussenii]
MESHPTATGSDTSKRKPTTLNPLSILTFRKMLSSALQDLFGSSMGGGINIDILGYWTDQQQDPYNRIISSKTTTTATTTTPSTSTSTSTSIPPSSSSATASTTSTTVAVTSTYSSMTAASAVLRCHALDFNQLWNALVLFNTLVDECESRFEVRYTSSTLLGLQANSRQLKWPN